MLNSSDLQRVNTFVDPRTGCLWAIPTDGRPPIQVTFPGGVNPDFQHVVNSSLVMFSTLNNSRTWLDKLIIWAEAANVEEIVTATMHLQGAINVACRCAIEGLENIANGREKRS